MEDKLKKINDVFKGIKKKYGDDSIVSFEDKEDYNIERYDIDSLSIKYVIGNGIPKGRVLEVYGENTHGKSLICQLLAKDIQNNNNGYVVWLDYEFSFDFEFARKIGLNLTSDKFKLINPSSIEDGFDIIQQLSQTGEIALVVWDSTNSSQTKAEGNSEYGSATMGQNARAFSQGFKKCISFLSKGKTSLILISQMREKFVMMGDNRVIGVGKAISFYASIRMEVKRVEYLFLNSTKKDVIGSKIRLKTIKNKTYTPMKEAEIDFCLQGELGINQYLELAEFAIKYGLVTGKGWYTMPDGTKIQGKESVSEYYKNNIEVFKDHKNQVIKLMFNPNGTELPVSEISESNMEENKGE